MDGATKSPCWWVLTAVTVVERRQLAYRASEKVAVSMLDWMTMGSNSQLLGLVIIVLIIILLGRMSFRSGWPG